MAARYWLFWDFSCSEPCLITRRKSNNFCGFLFLPSFTQQVEKDCSLVCFLFTFLTTLTFDLDSELLDRSSGMPWWYSKNRSQRSCVSEIGIALDAFLSVKQPWSVGTKSLRFLYVLILRWACKTNLELLNLRVYARGTAFPTSCVIGPESRGMSQDFTFPDFYVY